MSKGRCSNCGHVFVLLDNAVDALEAAMLRDKLEETRAKHAKEVLGGVSGVYAVEEKVSHEVETPKAEMEESDSEVVQESEAPSQEEPFEAIERDIEEETVGKVEERGGGEEDNEEGLEREVGLEIGTLEDMPEKPVQEEMEREEKENQESEVGWSFEEIGGQEDSAGTGEEENLSEGEDESELEKPKRDNEREETKGDAFNEEEGENLIDDRGTTPLGGAFEAFDQPKKRSSLLPILIIILVVLGIGGGSWFLYQTGQFSNPSGIIGSLVNKIKAIRGKSTLVLFELKNEQEPAVNGRFFSVRGYVQNRQNKSLPYVSLRIKIYDGKNRVIMTGKTIAGRILKPEEISKMTVQDALKQYKVMNEMNKKSSGKLGPNQKLPFLFLFDLNKFPRKEAKTFQVEVLGQP